MHRVRPVNRQDDQDGKGKPAQTQLTSSRDSRTGVACRTVLRMGCHDLVVTDAS